MNVSVPERDPYFAEVSHLLLPLLIDYYCAAEELFNADGVFQPAARDHFFEVRKAVDRVTANRSLPSYPERIDLQCKRIGNDVLDAFRQAIASSDNYFEMLSRMESAGRNAAFVTLMEMDAAHHDIARQQAEEARPARRFRWLNLFRWRRNREDAHPQPDRRPGVPAVRVLANGGTAQD
ncbi:hypothetical protein [Tautonia plasticadhaerens]|uniref:Uncharacterized protein n=1 Tax=Tautonia plasticadhaerens TaxID=2527974 RepID=A0A518H2B9_9BACT|nr:hypothetical protein [Tautonia plasticadhaerens]QDV35002.1 hypothetical protein ElP_28990 [Tautonia plasticadhaerens]